MGEVEAYQRALSLDGASSVASALAAAVGIETADKPFACSLCQRSFATQRMLQQHSQNVHSDKHFVCEICSKAFRFRSNLAEHRSVHTALKPFVCKFCGKSSRLKGNLVKHLLKWHTAEHFGPDDIIIKSKGSSKKSVKNPAAIEFLESSVIVLNSNSDQPPPPIDSQPPPPRQSASSRHSTVSADDRDRATPIGVTSRHEPMLDDRCFLLSLGLDAGSLDLKAESSESDSSMHGGTNTSNDKLLRRCNSLMDLDAGQPAAATGSEEAAESGGEEASGGDATTASSSATTDGGGGGFAPSNYTPIIGVAAKRPRVGGDSSTRSLLDGLAVEFAAAAAAAAAAPSPSVVAATRRSNGTTTGVTTATRCPQCNKHLRARELALHLANVHNIAPSQPPPSRPSLVATVAAESPITAIAPSVAQHEDMKQLLNLVLDMKTSIGHIHKIEQLVKNMDGRVTRLEKQLEMTLNSVYALVQLNLQSNAGSNGRSNQNLDNN